MNKKILAAVLSAAAISVMSCDKNQGIGHEPHNEETANVVLNISKSLITRAEAPAIEGDEDKLSSVEVFIFNAAEESGEKGQLELYHAASAGELAENKASMQLKTTTGAKHIYVVANCGGGNGDGSGTTLSETILNESQLLAAISEFSDNTKSRLVMVGSGKDSDGNYSPVLTGGSAPNKISVELSRLASRVKIGTIAADFTSPAVRNNKFAIKGVYMMNAAKQARYVNGNHSNVFGTEESGTLKPFPEGYGTDAKYYHFAVPAANGSDTNGFYNWADAGSFKSGDAFPINESTKELTAKLFGADEILLYAGNSGKTEQTGNKLVMNHSFYAYPNSSEPAATQDETDMTTKLIIETEYTEGETSKTYYYPISIPFMQPNYAYTIGTVTLHRLGSETPFKPVSSSDCSFEITVRNWDTGDIVGKFNHETTGDDFEI